MCVCVTSTCSFADSASSGFIVGPSVSRLSESLGTLGDLRGACFVLFHNSFCITYNLLTILTVCSHSRRGANRWGCCIPTKILHIPWRQSECRHARSTLKMLSRCEKDRDRHSRCCQHSHQKPQLPTNTDARQAHTKPFSIPSPHEVGQSEHRKIACMP